MYVFICIIKYKNTTQIKKNPATLKVEPLPKDTPIGSTPSAPDAPVVPSSKGESSVPSPSQSKSTPPSTRQSAPPKPVPTVTKSGDPVRQSSRTRTPVDRLQANESKTTCDEPFSFVQQVIDTELKPVKEGPCKPTAKQHNLERSSMGNPLKDQPNVETVDEDKDDMAPHLREQRKKGEPNPAFKLIEV